MYFCGSLGNDYLWVLKSTRIDMKYYSQYHSCELFELQESLEFEQAPTAG